MIRILLVTIFLIITIDARENPFFPSLGEKDIPITSNKDRTLPPLKRATISLPPQARIIKKVTVEYKSLDGSLESKTIELDNSVDWHLPLFISQSYNEKTKTDIKKPIKKVKYKKLGSIEFAKFYSLEKTLKVSTTDKMIRNFLLTRPHRIVLDFDRESHLKSYIKKNKNSIFSKIRVGNHSNYYRVVVELDGVYQYTLTKLPDGYLFELR